MLYLIIFIILQDVYNQLIANIWRGGRVIRYENHIILVIEWLMKPSQICKNKLFQKISEYSRLSTNFPELQELEHIGIAWRGKCRNGAEEHTLLFQIRW